MKYITLTTIILSLISCSSSTSDELSKHQKSKRISNEKNLAHCPYLSLDHLNNPVLSWVEGKDNEACLYYALSKDNGISFNTSIKVEESTGLSAHPESMPKVAFKDDGTVIAVYAKKSPTAENRFAGSIYYTQSFDGGKNWTKSMHLHTDTSSNVGRNFFDIKKLGDGEIGAVWLDGRKKHEKGSTLYFSKTFENSGFGFDLEIGQKTCQCCRTAIYIDKHQAINVAYRDIINDSIRDIVHLVSKDNGISFSNSKRISPDNWVINGCPHTGPTITSNKNGLNFFWFTMGGAEGVYQTNINNEDSTFTERKLINSNAKHPQAATTSKEEIALVWDETVFVDSTYTNRIGLIFQTLDASEKIKYITPENEDASHPVVIGLKDGKVLIAWTQKTENNSQVYYKLMENN